MHLLEKNTCTEDLGTLLGTNEIYELKVVFKLQIHPSSRKIYFSIGFPIITFFYEKTTHCSKYTPSHRSPSIDKAAQNTWKDFMY